MRANIVMCVILSAAGLVGACKSTPKAPTPTATESMMATGSRLDKANGQIDAVMGSLDGIVANKNGDLRSAYNKFSAEVSDLESSADTARKSANAMREHSKENFDAWANEVQNISDPTVKKAAMARRDQATASYQRVREANNSVRMAYEPFVSNLRDIRTALGSDLTGHGVDAMGPAINNAHSQASALKSALANLKGAMTDLKSQLVTPK
jgi:hypothetical protein